MVQVTDTLKTPLGNNLNATLRISATANTGSLLKFSNEEVNVTDGAVNFGLEEGIYTLWIKYSDTFEEVGTLTVTGSTPATVVLADILT